MRKLAIIGLSTLALTLAACGQKAEDPTAQASSSAAAGPESAPGVVVTDAMVRLPAVPGTPGAAYFTVSQGSGAPRKIAAIHVEGAERAEMHETVDKNGISSMQQVKDVPIVGFSAIVYTVGIKSAMLEVARTDIDKLAATVNDLARAQASAAVNDASHSRTLEDIQRRLESLERRIK